MKKFFYLSLYIILFVTIYNYALNSINAFADDLFDKTNIDLSQSLKTLIIKYDSNIPTDQQVVIITDFGAIVIKVFPDTAPKSVNTFLNLIKDKYYNSTSFYRLSPYYFIQAGDKFENGIGDAGITIPKETNDKTNFDIGTVALSNINGDPSTTGSQFFITFVKSYWLDGKYNIVGKVIYGLKTISSFFDKYDTNSQGIMSTKIPIKMYILSDLIAKFPNYAKTNILPLSSNLLEASKENKIVKGNPIKNLDITPNILQDINLGVLKPSYLEYPGNLRKIIFNNVNSNTKNSDQSLINILLKPRSSPIKY